jgi:cell division protein FtsQ
MLPVKDFIVSGVSQYEKNEVVEASGIKKGDKLYKIDKDEVEARLMESCLYFDSVKVVRKFPGTVVFRVEEKMAQWYVEVSGSYYALDSELLVLEETHSNEKFVKGGVPELVLPELSRMICGEKPQFGSSEAESERVEALLLEIQSTTFKSRLTLVDMESRFDIKVVVDGKYDVYIGDPTNVSEKLTEVERILKTDELKNCAGAEIDASLVPQPVTVRRIYKAE